MSSLVPDTRQSLILRLPDRHDIDAWDQFVAIYEPLVYRLARARGLQDADAHEVVQEVLLAVSKAVDRWDPDSERGRFRDWLFRIARNFVINYLTRKKYRSIGTGDSAIHSLLHNQVVEGADLSNDFDLEYRREIFHFAAQSVRRQVKLRTWQAFWRTAVEGADIALTASELQMTSGAVHIARSRVLSRLRTEVQRFEDIQTR